MTEDIVNDTVNSIMSKSASQPNETHKLKKATGLVKKSPAKKFAETFFAEDVDTFKKAFVRELLIPGIKDLIFTSIQRLFYNGGRSQVPGAFTSFGSSLVRDYVPNTNYNGISSAKSNTVTNKFDFSDLIFRDMAAARDFVNELRSSIAHYGQLSVRELYDTLDKVDGIDITDSYYGWYNLDNVTIHAVKTGFQVMLPQPVQLK